MAFVITRSCQGTCDTGCVDVCPCECIVGPVPLEQLRRYEPAERKRRFPGVQMFIDPDECVDCGACVPECPQEAIAHEDDLPPGSDETKRNAAFFSKH